MRANYPIEWSKSYDTTEEEHEVPARSDDRWRQMEAADWLSFAQRDQTLRRIAAAHSPGLPANAHDAIARVRTDGDGSPAGLCAGASKGRIFADGTRTQLRASASPDVCVVGMVLRSDRHGA